MRAKVLLRQANQHPFHEMELLSSTSGRPLQVTHSEGQSVFVYLLDDDPEIPVRIELDEQPTGEVVHDIYEAY
ncbi:hypothetical protein [Halosegnis longus]|uniref:hypothetical protein n=1 Tax=Halosegnis longus TaxID=2216012 RepID=UPI00129D3987|nr:hypothetical protein [Halosegnis longus]